MLFAVPTFASFYFSLPRWTLFDTEFIGLDNFRQFFNEPFLVQGFIGGGLGSLESPFHVYGPGDRGALPTVFPPGRPAPAPFNPSEPTPGTTSMVRQLLAAFATDVNDRIFDAGSPRIDRVVQAHDIALPSGITVPVAGPPARMSPFKPASSLSEDELTTLYDAIRTELTGAIQRAEGLAAKDLKSEKKSGMRVHGRTGEACPVCGSTVAEVSFADSSLQYCPTCQTGGKKLADRRMSRLLK